MNLGFAPRTPWPRRASQSEAGIARSGPTGMSVLSIRGRDAPYGQPRQRREAQSSRRPGPRGVILFGYFLLDKQEKVPRGRFTESKERTRGLPATKLVTEIQCFPASKRKLLAAHAMGVKKPGLMGGENSYQSQKNLAAAQLITEIEQGLNCLGLVCDTRTNRSA